MNDHPNLVLIGFMGAGKSTIGRRCALRLGYQFRDSDTVIEQRHKKSIPEIFAGEGEAKFREWECEVVHDLARCSNMVIATGGGIVLNSSNVARLRRSGIVVLLSAHADEIIARCMSRNTRPLLMTTDVDPVQRIVSMLEIRNPLYEAAANITVDTTGLDREEAVERVLNEFNSQVNSWRKGHGKRAKSE